MVESSVQNQSHSRRAASPNRGRKRPQGRGGKGGAKPKNTASLSTSDAPNAPAASTPNGEKTELDPLSKDTENPATQTQTDVQPDDDDDARQDEPDLCWICAEPIKYYAVSDCNHRTCHVCALRLRSLYKKLACTFCKVRATCSRAVVGHFDQRAQGTTTHSRVHPLPRCPLLVLYSREHPV